MDEMGKRSCAMPATCNAAFCFLSWLIKWTGVNAWVPANARQNWQASSGLFSRASIYRTAAPVSEYLAPSANRHGLSAQGINSWVLRPQLTFRLHVRSSRPTFLQPYVPSASSIIEPALT